MAEGALQHLKGDVSVAITGIAGPEGGTADKPVGTVWFAWADGPAGRAGVHSESRWIDGDREAVRRHAVAVALQGLLDR